ncbi:putative PGG domain-containing protein [Rosa chinensis]|uniref:Putative PGG domain-containing protein n=1 Tax=Rosa chinensis TaxID=74649 RepID=A0A2P6SDN2_ROSCH|nr:putative PGG domain-containing protein [Rosa chinensis]
MCINLGINNIREMKLIHVRSGEFLKLMCKMIKDFDRTEMQNACVSKALFQAVERGIPEFIIQVCKTKPELLWSTNEKKRSIFHFAIECRQEKIYNLIYGLHMKDAFATLKDISNNSLLHMAAMLSPFGQLNRITGPALKVQRELQWFKEVETIVPPQYLENLPDNKRPRDLFTKYHKKLVAEGEKWMKDTAGSCSLVGALIVTIMFAAAFTVPGGNDQNKGFPIFVNDKLFSLFIISDAISLISSSTSSLMFLEILTSRYAEEDFLKSLPTKMLVGLLSLFVSIATMMLAFCAALLLMLQGKPSTVFPLICLASVPVILFACLKFPLFGEIFNSTYGSSIFNRKVNKHWFV